MKIEKHMNCPWCENEIIASVDISKNAAFEILEQHPREIIKELRDALAFFNDHPKTMQDSRGYEELKVKVNSYLERNNP